MSYGARAGVIEPLAKAGQLRVVVATMGLAAGINFSLRSVALAGESYRRDAVEEPIRPDMKFFGGLEASVDQRAQKRDRARRIAARIGNEAARF